MIDKIDIRKAASSKHNPAFGVSGYLAARTAFAAGVEWFKKALWHSQDEIPEDGRIILVKGWYDCKRSGDYIIINTTEDINYSDVDPDRKFQWECFCERAVTPITWCYIEDLLPKGGEK
jgi:hypothetical protein